MPINTQHYTYRVRWSATDEAYVGTVAEFPSLSWVDEQQIGAFRGIQDLVAEIVADMVANGEEVPQPLAERSFSGKFMVRIPPETHRNLAIEAAEQNVSLNRLVSTRLQGATTAISRVMPAL